MHLEISSICTCVKHFIMNTVKERLKAFVEYLGVSVRQFEIECGLSNGYINSISRGIGEEKFNQIQSVYPNLSKKWVFLGEGEMLNNTIIEGNQNKVYSSISGNNNVIGENNTVNNSSINVVLPKKGDLKIIRSDGAVETHSEALIDNGQQVLKNSESRIRDLESIISSKDKTIELMQQLIDMLRR